MLEWLVEIQKNLKKRNIQMVVRTGNFVKIVPEMAKNACEIVAGGLKFQQKCGWETAKKINCRLTQIETNLMVPPETTWPKEEIQQKHSDRKIIKILTDSLLNCRRQNTSKAH